jgi:HSP20 family protein
MMTVKELSPSERRAPEPVGDGRRFIPSADIYESPEELTVLVDMPGVDAGNIDVRIDKGVLHLHGKTSPRQSQDVKFVLQEYEVCDYLRSFEVGDAIDAQRITAEHRDGVLVLHLPKSEKLRPKRIEVRAK